MLEETNEATNVHVYNAFSSVIEVKYRGDKVLVRWDSIGGGAGFALGGAELQANGHRDRDYTIDRIGTIGFTKIGPRKHMKFHTSTENAYLTIRLENGQEICANKEITKSSNYIVDSNDGSFEAPTTWTDMKGRYLKVVPLADTDQEYKDIETKFNQSVGRAVTILKMDKIQNRTLWQQYQAVKNLIDSQNKQGHQNETFLWHGTEPKAMKSINAYGFNKSYCRGNAAPFGYGVYFNVQAKYAARYRYSPPDASGVQILYYCRVLTGEYAIGKNGMRKPPAKPSAGGSHVLYDSVVSNVQHPGVYIIFNETQAYPEYLIAFK